MSVRFAKRAASELMNRGVNSIRINPNAVEDAAKAITKDDIRRLIKSGSIFAIKEKHNLSTRSKMLRTKRAEGRRRGPGRRKGTYKARLGRVWEKKIRSQRQLLKLLNGSKMIDNKVYRQYYLLAKGNAFPDKASLILHLRNDGITLDEEQLKQVNEQIKKSYM